MSVPVTSVPVTSVPVELKNFALDTPEISPEQTEITFDEIENFALDTPEISPKQTEISFDEIENFALDTPEISPEQTEITVDEIEIKDTDKLTLEDANKIERIMDTLICDYSKQVNNNEGKEYCGKIEDGKSTPENIIKWFIHLINNDPDRKINFDTVNKKILNQQMNKSEENIYKNIKNKVIKKYRLTNDITPNRVLQLLKEDLQLFHKKVLKYAEFHNLKLNDNEMQLKLFKL